LAKADEINYIQENGLKPVPIEYFIEILRKLKILSNKTDKKNCENLRNLWEYT